MTKKELERLYMDIYDNGIADYDYKEKFKRYVNNRLENLEKKNGKLEGKIQDWMSEYYELENFMNNKVEKAKEIIKSLLSLKSTISSKQDIENRLSVREKAEEFLKEE